MSKKHVCKKCGNDEFFTVDIKALETWAVNGYGELEEECFSEPLESPDEVAWTCQLCGSKDIVCVCTDDNIDKGDI